MLFNLLLHRALQLPAEHVRLGMVIVGAYYGSVCFRSVRHNRNSVPLERSELTSEFVTRRMRCLALCLPLQW